MEVTGLEQFTSAKPVMSLALVSTRAGPAVITQVIVWSPQLAGLIPEPAFATHGRITWGPTPWPAWARAGAVMVVFGLPCGAPWAAAEAGTALAAAMSSPPPAAATAMVVAASALVKRDTDFLLCCPSAPLHQQVRLQGTRRFTLAGHRAGVPRH